MGWDNMISAAAREGSLKLMACDAQLLAQICCSHLFFLGTLKHSLQQQQTPKNKPWAFWNAHVSSLEVNLLGSHTSPGQTAFSRTLNRFAELSTVKMLWHVSHRQINYSVRPNVGLINTALHWEKGTYHCSKINGLFTQCLSFQMPLT